MRKSLHSSNRGFTLLEALFAALILSMALVALFQLWDICYNRIQNSGEISEAGQLARAELERAKVFGAESFPTGTYNQGTGLGTWNGSFNPTANSGAGGWVSGHTEYFDLAGTRLSSAGDTGVRYSVSLSVIDSAVLAGSGSTYQIANNSLRALVVTVNRLPDNTVLFSAGSNLVVGGL